MNRTDFTFIITTYRSSEVIFECIKDIPNDIKIIVVDNSANEKLKLEIEKNFTNIDYYLMPENYGYGKGNNFGFKNLTQIMFLLLIRILKLIMINFQKF